MSQFRIWTIVAVWACSYGLFAVRAQQHQVFDCQIKSLIVSVRDDLKRPPIIRMGEGEQVEISFDEMSHDYRRLAYRVEHCEADWQVSDQLMESDYLTGPADDLLLPSVTQSMNTAVLYTHYAVMLPNTEIGIHLSGNYRVTIYDEENGDASHPLAYAYFSVAESLAQPAITISANTDKEWNGRYQQVSARVNFSNLTAVNHPGRQLKLCVLQNFDWSTAVWPDPMAVLPTSLDWQHCADLIFPAGNEFRKVELLDVNVPTMGVDSIRHRGGYHHLYLYTDAPRKNYVYDEDQDGGFVFRQTGSNVSTECEYVKVHFTLRMPPCQGGQIIIDGRWRSAGAGAEPCVMTYQNAKQQYEATLLLKQGYYNYRYLFVPDGDMDANLTVESFKPVEGNYFQTENQYTALVYFREIGGRTDRLVGWADAYSQP